MYIGARSLLAPFRRTAIGMPAAFVAPPQAETTTWVAAVVTNGGTVSAGRQTIVNNFVYAEKQAGTWDLTDDYWGLWGENAPQALTSLKQRRLTTATAAPTFTADRGYVFNGTSQYLNTGFVPSTHTAVMSITNVRIGVYERTNIGGAGGVSAGSNNATAGVSLYLSANVTVVASRPNISSGLLYALAPMNPAGWTAASRNGSANADCRMYKNGVALVQSGSVTTFGPNVPSFALYVGGLNNAGTAGSFRANSVGFVAAGAGLSAAQELAQYNNIQAWATAVGAQV